MGTWKDPDYLKKWYRRNRKRMIAKNFANSLKRNYGLDFAVYIGMKKEQRNLCVICGIPHKRKLCVDHCHETGKIRGLLCNDCNVGLSRFKELPVLLRSAAVYLEAA